MKVLNLDAKPSFLSKGANVADVAGFGEGTFKADAAGTLVLDAQGQVFFQRQLELIKSETFDYEYHELKADKMIPVDTEGDLGVETITYRRFSKRGYAKIIADYATDIPRVDILGEEVTVTVKTVAAAYGYNIFEIARAQRAGVALASRRAQTATDAIMERLDRAAWYGSPNDGLQGFFDFPGILEYIIPNGTGGFPEFSTKTSAEILADMNGITRLVKTTTRGKRIVNQMIMPIEQHDIISTKQNSTATDISVLQYFLNTHPGVSVDWVEECKGAGPLGEDIMMAYVKSPRNLYQNRPVPMMTLPQEYKNMEYIVTQIARTGGLSMPFPQSAAKSVGI